MTKFYNCPVCGHINRPAFDFLSVILIKCEACGTKSKIQIEEKKKCQ